MPSMVAPVAALLGPAVPAEVVRGRKVGSRRDAVKRRAPLAVVGYTDGRDVPRPRSAAHRAVRHRDRRGAHRRTGAADAGRAPRARRVRRLRRRDAEAGAPPAHGLVQAAQRVQPDALGRGRRQRRPRGLGGQLRPGRGVRRPRARPPRRGLRARDLAVGEARPHPGARSQGACDPRQLRRGVRGVRGAGALFRNDPDAPPTTRRPSSRARARSERSSRTRSPWSRRCSSRSVAAG